jgi:hypothetical protein
MADKFARISNLMKDGKEAQVLDEKLEDTLNDLINYSAILKAALEDESDDKAKELDETAKVLWGDTTHSKGEEPALVEIKGKVVELREVKTEKSNQTIGFLTVDGGVSRHTVIIPPRLYAEMQEKPVEGQDVRIEVTTEDYEGIKRIHAKRFL